MDAEGNDAWRVLGHLLTRRVDGLVHLTQNIHAPILCLTQGDFHDFPGNAVDLDVHLQGIDAVLGAGHLEIHVTQVILVTQNIREYGKVIAFLDQAHGHAGYRRLHGHARVHQGQTGATHGRHGGGAVGFRDFGNHADGIGKVFQSGHHCQHAPLGQAPMTDLAALGTAHTTGLTHAEWREVVVQHEGLAVGTIQGIHDLGVTLGAQGGNHQSLGFTTGEQGRTMGAWQHAGLDADVAHGLGITTVDTRLTGQNTTAHGLLLQLVQSGGNLLLAPLGIVTGTQGLDSGGLDLIQLGVAVHLVNDGIGFTDAGTGNLRNLVRQGAVFLGNAVLHGGLAHFLGQFLDGLDGHLHLLMTEQHGAQHHFLGQLAGLGFDHQHGLIRTCNHEIQVSHLAQAGARRIEQVFSILVAHAGRAYGPLERQPGNGQGRAGADEGRNFRIHVGIVGHHRADYLHLVGESLGKQGTDGPVDETCHQDLLLGRTTLATEETTRNLARGIGLFLVIDGQGKEVTAFHRVLGAHHGAQHHSIFHVDDYRAVCLTGDFPGFQRHFMIAELELFLDCSHLRVSFA